jgi:hypothetical protein
VEIVLPFSAGAAASSIIVAHPLRHILNQTMSKSIEYQQLSPMTITFTSKATQALKYQRQIQRPLSGLQGSRAIAAISSRQLNDANHAR